LERDDLTETGSGAVSGAEGAHPAMAIRTQAARIRFDTFETLLGLMDDSRESLEEASCQQPAIAPRRSRVDQESIKGSEPLIANL
jgi:hypothetical protein